MVEVGKRFLSATSGPTRNLVSQILLLPYLVCAVASLIAVEQSVGVALTPASKSLMGTIAIACFLPAFFWARFSFGYILGVAFYGVIAGYQWLSYFTLSSYNHEAARWSLAGSFAAFCIPALFQTFPLKRNLAITNRAMSLSLKISLLVASIILLLDARYGFAFVGLQQAAEIRNDFIRPALLNYATGILIYSILPFAFAFFAERRCYGLAAASLILIALFFPILLNKTVLFAPIWLLFIFLLFSNLDGKLATALVFLAPLLLGLTLGFTVQYGGALNNEIVDRYGRAVFGIINERMYAVPSIALDYYLDFFSHNPNTYFCQVNIVHKVTGCLPSGDLGPVFASRYGVGNLNASLFAAEGIASVGISLAPIATFFCGLLLSVGNSVSARHSAALIATSAGLAVQALLSIPLSINLLTNGLLILFLIWCLCPDTVDEERQKP